MRASITVFLCGMAACSPVTTERCPTMGEAPAAPSSVDAATTEPETIPLEPYQTHGHRSVQVTLGGETLPFLFDTGGGLTFISPTLAERIGCRPEGRLVGFRMRGDQVALSSCRDVSLNAAGLPLPSATVGVFDLSTLLPPDWPALGGLVGLSSFVDRVLRIDLAGGKLEISATPPSGDVAPVRLVRQASGLSVVVLIPVVTPRGELWLELDSGSDAPLILAPHAAAMLGVDVDDPATLSAGVAETQPAPEGAPPSWRVPKIRLPLPNVGEVETEAKVMDIIYDGNVGVPLMERFLWTLDLKTLAVKIEPRASPSGVAKHLP
ncbi:MAG: aspartyl protease family protein [Polyangiaceae bacterium]